MINRRLLAILGSGGHASSVADAAISAGFRIVGFLGSPASQSNSALAPLIDDISELDLDVVDLCLGVGTNFLRDEMYREVMSAFPAARFPQVAHSTAWVSPEASMGAGSVVLAQASIGPKARMGIGSLLNTGASLDHHSTLGDFASLGPGARAGGTVEIGQRTMVGLQVGILQGLRVGRDTVIGAQSLVTTDMPQLSVAMGSPCSVSRTRTSNDPYY